MKRPPRAYKREERKRQVLRQFGVWQSNGDNEPKTMNRIAKAIGMIPAHSVTEILLEMVAEGTLGFNERDQKGKWTTRFYYSTVKTLITEKYGKRRVSVKSKGAVVGSLEIPAGQMGLWS